MEWQGFLTSMGRCFVVLWRPFSCRRAHQILGGFTRMMLKMQPRSEPGQEHCVDAVSTVLKGTIVFCDVVL